MQIQFATRKCDGGFEAALIVDGKFQRSGSSRSVMDLFSKLCGPLLAVEQNDGAEIAVNITILSAAEASREELRMQRARQASEAEQEANEIEKLTKALTREAEARATALSGVGGA